MRILLSIRSTTVVEEPYISFDALTFECFSFVLQQPQRQEKSRVSRQPVFVLVLLSDFVTVAQPEWRGFSWDFVVVACYALQHGACLVLS